MEEYELSPITITAEETKEIATPEGMRKRIEKYSKYDALTYSCLKIANLNKLDRMTLIAFQALVENQRLKKKLIKTNPKNYF